MIPVSLDGKTFCRMDIKRLEKVFEIHYIPRLLFADEEVERYINKKLYKADKRGKIEPLARWLGAYHGRHLDDENIPPVSLRWVNEKIGYGIFAETTFKKWQFIGEYAGVLRRRKIIFPDANDYCFMYPIPFKIRTKAFTIDSEKKGNLTRYINHSDYPNAESICVFYKGIFRVVIRAAKEIQPGEEITYDYGEYYWQKRIKFTPESSLAKDGSWLKPSCPEI